MRFMTNVMAIPSAKSSFH